MLTFVRLTTRKSLKRKFDEGDFLDWWGWAILNIRSKMDHTVAKNFSLCWNYQSPLMAENI